jgi:mono/diheme cytochrome c family protein
MKTAFRLLVFLLALGGALSLLAGVWLWSRGIDARDEPATLEIAIARRARHLAVPASARDRVNPVAASPDSVRLGLEHWADHCASCHGNNGSGDTSIGRALYPRAPDMRQAETQDLTDGELFYIIENGVKLTGMPAWGTGTEDGEAASWHLVHFIRHLPKLSDEELAVMEELNPRSPAEWRALEEERKFLAGESDAPTVAPSHGHKGGHQ